MLKQGTDGEDTQIQAYSDMIRQPIWVIVNGPNQMSSYIKIFDENYNIPKIPIIIYNFDQIHYQAVMPVVEANTIRHNNSACIAFVKDYVKHLPDGKHGLYGTIQTDSDRVIDIYGCRRVECGGWGDCLFHTLTAFSIVQEQAQVPDVVTKDHITLRREIVDYLRHHPQKYKSTAEVCS